MGDPAGAIAALSSTAGATEGADPGIMAARQLLYARAESERGNKDAALAMAQAIATADADELRADIYAGRADWPHAAAALVDLEHKRITDPATLDGDQQALVMRLAVAATLSGDAALLQRVGQSYAAAMAKGSNAAMFRLMTSSPVRQAADLPRAFEDIKLARQLQGQFGGEARH